MATLDLQINASQAERAAATFQRVITDIQRTVLALDNLTFSNAITRIDRLISNIVKLENAAERVVTSLGAIQYTLNSVAASPHLNTLHNKFSSIRDVIREMQTALKGFESSVGTVARTSERVRPPSRPTTPPVQTQAAAPEITKALVRVEPPRDFVRETELLLGELRGGFQVTGRTIESFVTSMSGIRTSLESGSGSFQSMSGNLNVLRDQLRAFNAVSQQFGGFNTSLVDAAQKTQLLSVSMAQLRALNLSQITDQVGQFNASLFSASQSTRTLEENMNHLRAVNLRGSIVEQLKSVDMKLLQTNTAVERLRASLAGMRGPNFTLLPGAMAGQGATDAALEKLFSFKKAAPITATFTQADAAASRKFNETFAALEIPADNVGKALKGVKEHKDRLDKNMNSMTRGSLANFYRGFQTLRVLLAGFTIFALIRGFREFSDELVETGRELQHSKALFLAATRGNVDEADRLRVVARNLANEFGAPLIAMEQNFAKFAGAAQGTNLQGKLLDDTFRGVASAVAVLGVGSEKATNIIKVFTDIMGKGRVQSEEVVKQFGNAVPGAYRRVADALGMTTAQLTQALQRGTLLATDVVSRVGLELGRIYEDVAKKQADTLIGSFNNLQNAVIQFKEAILLGGAEQGFIDFFKGLASVLRDEGMLASAREIGEAFGKTLRTALDVLIPVMKLFIENWRIIASFFVTGAVFAGILVVVSGIGLLVAALKALSIAAIPAFGWIGVFASLAGIIANLTIFSSNTEKASEETEKMTKRNRELAEAAAASAQSYDEQSRAFIQAQERMAKEIRTFAQDQRAAAEAVDLVNAGISTQSIQFETFTKVGERVRALVRAGTFQAFGADAEKQQQAFTNQALAIEKVAVALGHVVKMQKELNEVQQSTRVEAFTAATTSRLGTALTQDAVSLQSEYDKRVIPVLERTREIIASFTDPADKEKADFIAQGFDAWNKKLLETLKISHDIRTEMQGMVNLANAFRDLQSSQRVLQLSANIRPGRELAAGQSPLAMARQFVPEAVGARAQLQARLLPGFAGRTDAASKQALDVFKKAFDDFEAMNKPPAEKMADASNKFLEGANKFNVGVDKFTGTPSVGGVAAGGVGRVPSMTTGGGTSFDFSKNQYAEMIRQSSAKYGVDPELAARVILRGEASGASAVSPKGATGVAQVMPTTAAGLPEFRGMSLTAIQQALKDPATSINAGIQYLGQQLENFNGNVTLAVAAYNTGPGNVQRVGGNVSRMAAETQAYVPRVLAGYQGTGTTPSEGSTLASTLAEPFKATGRIFGHLSRQSVDFSDFRKVQSDLVKNISSGPGMGKRPDNVPFDLSGIGMKSLIPELSNTFETAGKGFTVEVGKAAEEFQKLEQSRRELPVNVPMPTAVLPLQAEGIDLSGLFNEIQTTLVRMASEQGVKLTPEQELEKQITAWKATEKSVRDLGVTQEDVDNKTQKYFQALLTGSIAGQEAVNQLILRGDQHLKQLENENKDIQDQIKLLEKVPALRDLEADAIRRKNQAEASGGLTTAKQRQLFAERDAAIRASQDEYRQKSFSDQFSRAITQETAMMQAQLSLLRMEPQQRALATEALQKYVEIDLMHLDPEVAAARKAEVDSWTQMKAAIEAANGPLQQYIDSLSEAQRNFKQQAVVDFFRGAGSGITETLFGLQGRLQERGKGVAEAESRARSRVLGIPAWDKENRARAEREGREEVRIAKESQAGLAGAILAPLISFGESFAKNLFNQAIDQLMKGPLQGILDIFGKEAAKTPEVAAIQDAATRIVNAIEHTGGVGGRRGGGVVGVATEEEARARVAGLRERFGDVALPEGTEDLSSSLGMVDSSLGSVDVSLAQVSGDIASLTNSMSGLDNSIFSLIGQIGGAAVGGGGGGGWGSIFGAFGSLFSGFGGGAGESVGAGMSLDVINSGGAVGSGFGMHGGIVGRDLGGPVMVPAGLFRDAQHFQYGGLVGTDNYPALLTRGEGVFTEAQMSKLAPAEEGGPRVMVNGPLMIVNTPNADSFRKTGNQLAEEMHQKVERQAARSGQRGSRR